MNQHTTLTAPNSPGFSDGPNAISPVALGTAGYYIYPTFEYRKYPTRVQGRPWTEFWDNREIEGLTAFNGALTRPSPAFAEPGNHPSQPTGWAVALGPNDPAPLLVLDVDAYEDDPEPSSAETALEAAREHALAIWNQLLNVDTDRHGAISSLPHNVGCVLTPSGGVHLYFRLPDDVDPRLIPPEFNFGTRIKGEIRFSNQPRPRILMLPGSRATNKKGTIGQYTVYRPFQFAALAPPPPNVMLRLTGRSHGQSRAGNDEDLIEISRAETSYQTVPPRQTLVEAKLPTEVHHLLGILQRLQVDEGGRNNFLAAAAMIIGRITGKRPNDTALALIEHTLQGCLSSQLTGAEFKKALHSGLKRGTANAKHFGKADAFPSATLVLTEFVSIFGAHPYLVRFRRHDGTIDSYELGIGGSARRREERKRFTMLKSLQPTELLAALSKVVSADLDVVSQSPLFTQLAWTKVLLLYLHSRAEDEYIGAPPLEVFWDTVINATIEAANEGNFGTTLSSRVAPANAIFLSYIRPNNEEREENAHTSALSDAQHVYLAMTPMQTESLVTMCGDITVVRKLLDLYGKPRKVYYKSGRRRCTQTYFVDLLLAGDRLDSGTMDLVFSKYYEWKQQQTKEHGSPDPSPESTARAEQA